MSKDVQNIPETPKSTEVDLGDLFRMIGRGINKLVVFFRNTFLFLLDVLIRALIVIRVHILKFIIVGILSLAIGWFLDSRQPKMYGANMVIETNYGSARQLYSNIKFYNALAVEGDSTQLSKIFGIDESAARNLKGFFIEPDVSENRMLSAYDNFMRNSDTAFVKKEIDFARFKKNVDPLDFKIHQIGVISGEKSVFPELQSEIISHDLNNEYIEKQKEIYLKNLGRKEEALKRQLQDIDTLRNVYNESLITEAKKTSSSQTHIQMTTSNTVKTNELELFSLDEKISDELLRIESSKELQKNIINVLSNFSTGYEIKNFYQSYVFKIPVVMSLLLLTFILLRELNRYLNTYSENRRMNE